MEELNRLSRFVLDEAKTMGADYAQCVVSESEKKVFNVDGGEFSLMRTLFDRDVVITLLKDQRKGTVHVNRFEEAAIRGAIADCLEACAGAESDPAWQFADEPSETAYTDGSPSCDTDLLFSRTEELLHMIRERHPKILLEQMITEHDAERSLYRNSNGVCCRTESGSYRFSLMYSGHEGEKSTSFFSSDVTLKTLDRPVIETALFERELSAIENQLDPSPLQGKFVGTVLLAPSALLEIVLSTVIGKFVSDSSLIDGSSIWKDKLGQSVADPRFSLRFAPNADEVVDRTHLTGEGYPAEDYDLIRDGRLVSFALSQYGANKTGGKRAGNNSWNMFVPAGEKSLEEIIRCIDRGVLVMRFSGGDPASSGEFSGVAKNSFLIENGRVSNALTETMISGCIPDMLNHIREISSDRLLDGFLGLPYIAFDGLTVSGK